MLDAIGTIDLVIERSEDPSWLADWAHWVLNPPSWFLLLAVAGAFVLLLWPLLKARFYSKLRPEDAPTLLDDAPAAKSKPAIGLITPYEAIRYIVDCSDWNVGGIARGESRLDDDGVEISREMVALNALEAHLGIGAIFAYGLNGSVPDHQRITNSYWEHTCLEPMAALRPGKCSTRAKDDGAKIITFDDVRFSSADVRHVWPPFAEEYIPIAEASRRLYEARRNDWYGRELRGAYQSPNEILEWGINLLIVKEVQFFGKRPLSREMEMIPPEELKSLYPSDDLLHLREMYSKTQGFTDVEVKASAVKQAILDMAEPPRFT